MAEAKEPKKVPHLKDLFKTGQMATIKVYNHDHPDEPLEIQIWMRKPSSSQHEEALTKGRGAQARKRNEFRDKSSDAYVALQEEINSLETKEDVVDKLLAYEEQRLNQQAFNEVLYPEVDDDEEEEPRWGSNGAIYIDLLEGVRARYEEIVAHNAELSPDEPHLRIKLEEDEELVRLNEEQKEFQKEVDEKKEILLERERAKLMAESATTLREKLRKKMVELEVGMAFFQEYKGRLLYFSCRMPEDKSTLYWSSPEDLWEQPQFIQSQILSAYDDLEMGSDDLKNSLSLLPS